MSNKRCLRCGRTERQHAAGGKCLFEPTRFEGRPATDRELYGLKRHILRRFTNGTFCGNPRHPITFEKYVELENNLDTSRVCRQCMKAAEHDLHTYRRSQ